MIRIELTRIGRVMISSPTVLEIAGLSIVVGLVAVLLIVVWR